MKIRVLIVDGYSMVRAGLREFLKCDPALEVVAEATDGHEALSCVRCWLPDVVVTDLFLPDIDGITLIATIKHEFPALRVLVLTANFHDTSVTKAIRAGASGYLCKNIQAVELNAALKEIAAGQVYLAPEASAALLHELQSPHLPEPLTGREMQVLHHLAQGQANREIAHHLHLSEDTVKTHMRHILAKLGVQSRSQAILAAMRLKLLAHDLISEVRS